MLRQLRDGQTPVNLNGPDGSVISTVLWALDDKQARLSFSADPEMPALGRLIEADEAVAVAYMDSVKLQFDIERLVLVRGPQACSLRCSLPSVVYRFQRRHAFRVRTHDRQSPVAHFRHASIPDMTLSLRLLDISIGGCALWLPGDLPPLQAGTRFSEVTVELDAETRFQSGLALQHITAQGHGERGARLGCEWQGLSGNAQRTLQRWIDHLQKRRRLLGLG